MKLIVFKKEVLLDADANPCKAGEKYIVSDGFLQQIRDTFSNEVLEGIYPFMEIPEKAYRGQDLTGKTLLVWRTGGMGDLCFITPNLRYIKENFKDSKIIFGCGSRFKYGMMHQPHIDELVPLPIDYKLLLKADYYLMFEGIIENNDEAKHINAYDLFERRFGFSGKITPEKKNPILGISKDHLEKAKKLFNSKIQSNESIKVIGLGLRASHIIRSLPPSHLNEIMKIILATQPNYYIALLGGKDDRDVAQSLPMSQHPKVIHCYSESFDFRDTIAQISLCDGVIGPDSGTVHIAAAFHKPIVGVYGPFPSHLRLQYYQHTSAFDINIPCGPCFMHGIETCDYSDLMTKEPLCMHTHNPTAIVSEMINLVETIFKIKTGVEKLPVLRA